MYPRNMLGLNVREHCCQCCHHAGYWENVYGWLRESTCTTPWALCRVGLNHTFIGVFTILLARKLPYIRSYMVQIYVSGQPNAYLWPLSIHSHSAYMAIQHTYLWQLIILMAHSAYLWRILMAAYLWPLSIHTRLWSTLTSRVGQNHIYTINGAYLNDI